MPDIPLAQSRDGSATRTSVMFSVLSVSFPNGICFPVAALLPYRHSRPASTASGSTSCPAARAISIARTNNLRCCTTTPWRRLLGTHTGQYATPQSRVFSNYFEYFRSSMPERPEADSLRE